MKQMNFFSSDCKNRTNKQKNGKKKANHCINFSVLLYILVLLCDMYDNSKREVRRGELQWTTPYGCGAQRANSTARN